jgi:hypothetical protein
VRRGTSRPTDGRSARADGERAGMRLRDQSKWDLALAALTLAATAVIAGSEVARWITRRFASHAGNGGSPRR